MPAPYDVAARRRPPALPPLAPLAAIPVLLALLAVGMASAERPSPGALRISAADAAGTGTLVGLRSESVEGSRLVEVHAPGSGVLLAVSVDGGQAALADQLGQQSGSLTVAHADGSQLRVALPGLISAAFAPDSSWLAVVDGGGALWRVDAATGERAPIADGPFLGSPTVATDGSMLLLAVSSIEAPIRSQLVRVAPPAGTATVLSGDGVAYGGFALDDGSVAAVVHESGRTVVRQVAGGPSRLLATLEPGAVNVAVGPDGRKVAYEVAERGIVLLDPLAASTRSLGPGSHPCFAPDGTWLLVRRGAGSAALGLDGSVLAVSGLPAGLGGAAGCLP